MEGLNTFQVTQVTPVQLKEFLRDILHELLKEYLLPAEPDDDEHLARKEAAKFLGISVSNLTKLKRNGKVKAVYIGRRVFYKKAELRDYRSSLPK